MSLYKQLTILITTFLVCILSIILWFILNHNKDLIENQVNSNAKNSASFLGLSISRNIDFEDLSTIEGMISSIIDNGFYEYIAVYDNEDKELIKIVNSTEIKSSPEWFSNIFHINTSISSANLMNGWLNVGVLKVKIGQDYVNNQMWNTFKSISQIFIISTFLLLFLFYLFINKLLKPLKKLSLQAKAIDNNEFIIEKELPNTIEFKNVVLAMNKTISKMETIFNKEVETLNKYNHLLYKDDDTKLGNKNYLKLKLNSYLKNSHGLLIFIDIKDELSFKKKIGFKDYFAFKSFIIDEINDRFSSIDNMVFSKLNDGVLSILLPNIHYESVKEKIQDLYKDIHSYIQDKNLNDLFNLKLAIGISNYVQNTSLKDILSKTDQSLCIAMKKEALCVNYLEEDIKFNKKEWTELLQWAFDNNGLLFHTQDVLDIESKKVFMKEYYTRIKDKNGLIYSAGDFWSIVLSMGLMEKLEKQIMEKIFESLENTKINNNSVINLSLEFVKNKSNIDWLISKLKNKSLDSNNIFYFECINSEVLNNIESYKYFSTQIALTKHKFAIESFTFDNDNLDYLKILKPSYLKISKSYLVDNEHKMTDSILLNITSTIGSYLIVKHVESFEEYKQLKALGIKYLQGRYIDDIEVS